jgi:hypothetical protein
MDVGKPTARATVKGTSMRPRLAHPPDPIARASRSPDDRRKQFRLIHGKVLPVPPSNARPGMLGELLPYSLGSTLDGSEPVAARVDVEDRELERFARPDLERVERGRDFYVSDGTGHALVRLADRGGRLHDAVELHLDSPFVTRDIGATRLKRARTAFVRALRVGDTVYLWGRVRAEPDDSGLSALLGGYRDVPAIAVFAGDSAPLHLWDEAAFQQVAAWHALPWYRKLSLLARNR